MRRPRSSSTTRLRTATGSVGDVLERLGQLSYPELLESEELAEVLGYPRSVNPLDYAVTPRGLRVLSQIPRLPENVARRVVAEPRGARRHPPRVQPRAGGGRGRRAGAGARDPRGVAPAARAQSRGPLPPVVGAAFQGFLPKSLENWRFQAVSAILKRSAGEFHKSPAFWRIRAKGRVACTRSATRSCTPTTVQEPWSRRKSARCSASSANTSRSRSCTTT